MRRCLSVEHKHSWYRFLSRLSVSQSVCLLVCSESVLWQNGWVDLDVVWGGKWGRSRDWCIRLGLLSSKGKGSFGDEFGTSHCNKWGLLCIAVREHSSIITVGGRVVIKCTYISDTIMLSAAHACHSCSISFCFFCSGCFWVLNCWLCEIVLTVVFQVMLVALRLRTSFCQAAPKPCLSFGPHCQCTYSFHECF